MFQKKIAHSGDWSRVSVGYYWPSQVSSTVIWKAVKLITYILCEKRVTEELVSLTAGETSGDTICFISSSLSLSLHPLRASWKTRVFLPLTVIQGHVIVVSPNRIWYPDKVSWENSRGGNVWLVFLFFFKQLIAKLFFRLLTHSGVMHDAMRDVAKRTLFFISFSIDLFLRNSSIFPGVQQNRETRQHEKEK